MTTRAYQIVAEVTALLPELLSSIDPRVVAWTVGVAAPDAANLLVACVAATRRIDAIRWGGVPEDEDQRLAWPRLDGPCGDRIGPVEDAGGESIAGLPAALREAHAIQAAAEYMAATVGQGGVVAAAEIEAAIAAGLTSQSVPGRSESYDPRRAGNPWNHIEPECRQLLARYRLAGGGLV